MGDTTQSIVHDFEELGFTAVTSAAANAIVDEPHAVDLSVLDHLDVDAAVPQRLVSWREVRYKNEYHDEPMTLVQATVFDEVSGLGSVKALTERFAARRGVGAQGVSLRPAFIFQVVPAIEMSVGGVPFAAGGMVRPEVLRKRGLKIAEHSIYVLVLTTELVARI